MNNDLISKIHFDKRVREAVGMTISELTEEFKDGVRTTLELLKTEPTVDAVPVVRCRDCKEWDEENHWCNIRDSYGWDYKPNDYCSYGVRKAGK